MELIRSRKITIGFGVLPKMSENYPAEKIYSNKKTVEEYDSVRFKSFRGKIGNWLDQFAVSRLLKRVPVSEKVLDIPCGTGRFTEYLFSLGLTDITAADISNEMLEIAKKKLGSIKQNINFIQIKAEDISRLRNEFDCIFSIRFFGHLPLKAQFKVLEEFSKSAPSCIIEIPIKGRLRGRRLLKPIVQGDNTAWHKLDWQTTVSNIEAAGLKVVKKRWKVPFISDSCYLLLERK